jgi:glutamate/tyrosine decarboxylase-like PLP-dependent enzyme
MESPVDQLRRDLHDPLPYPEGPALHHLGSQVLDWLLHHFATLPDQPIGHTPTRAELEALLSVPPPEDGRPFDDAFLDFQTKVAPNAFRINHPRFLAFIPAAPTFHSILGDMLCAGTNFFAGVWLEGAGPAQVEIEVINWFRDFLGLPPETHGLLTSGGSEANLIALVVARDDLAHEERGRAVLYLTQERHWSMDRAARVMGLRPDQIRPIPVGDDYCVQPDALTEAIREDRAAGRRPWAVGANAGATNTGAVDPLDTLAAVCREHRLWFHVDAAYGWPAVLISEGRRALRGIELADSVTLDPHKWFAQTFEAGCVLIRSGRRLPAAFAIRPDYLQDVEPAGDEVNFADYGLALTRRFRALKIWFSVQVLGVGWFRRLIERSCRLAELAQLLLDRAGCFEILCRRQLSVVCFRYVPAGMRRPADRDDARLNRLNLALVEALRETGRAFLSSTRLNGRVALRFCFVNWRTTTADVDEVIQLLTSLGQRLETGTY